MHTFASATSLIIISSPFPKARGIIKMFSNETSNALSTFMKFNTISINKTTFSARNVNDNNNNFTENNRWIKNVNALLIVSLSPVNRIAGKIILSVKSFIAGQMRYLLTAHEIPLILIFHWVPSSIIEQRPLSVVQYYYARQILFIIRVPYRIYIIQNYLLTKKMNLNNNT